jgi:hypothetical protein
MSQPRGSTSSMWIGGRSVIPAQRMPGRAAVTLVVMPDSPLGTLRVALAMLACAGALMAATAAAATAARKPLRCRSADLRYPFQPGGPKDFGVFKLAVTGGGCRTAHRVAHAWMKRFEAHIRAGELKLPRLVDGFTFKNLPVREAQTFRERGRRRGTTIRFDYRVPNG